MQNYNGVEKSENARLTVLFLYGKIDLLLLGLPGVFLIGVHTNQQARLSYSFQRFNRSFHSPGKREKNTNYSGALLRFILRMFERKNKFYDGLYSKKALLAAPVLAASLSLPHLEESVSTINQLSPRDNQITIFQNEFSEPRTELRTKKQHMQIVDEGRLTVYSYFRRQLWEEEVYNRTGIDYFDVGFTHTPTALQPDLYDDPESQRLIQERRMIGVNPAMVSPRIAAELYRISVAERGQKTDAQVIEAVYAQNDMLFQLIEEDVLGRHVYLQLQDRQEKMIVMSVFQWRHALEDLGYINLSRNATDTPSLNFVGDVHQRFMREKIGIYYDEENGHWVDNNGNATSNTMNVQLLVPIEQKTPVKKLTGNTNEFILFE